MNRILVFGGAALGCFFLALCAIFLVRPLFRTRGIVTVVSILPRSGPDQAWSDPIVQGIKLAIDEHGNAAGWCKVRYEDWDYADSIDKVVAPETSLKRTAMRAVADRDVFAVIGPFDPAAAKVIVPILHEARLLCVSPGEADPSTPRPAGHVNYFRVAARTDVLGTAAAERAHKLGAKRVFVLRDGERPSPDSAEVFCREAEKLGLRVVGGESLGTLSDAALRGAILKLQPDLVYFSGMSARRFGALAEDLDLGGYTGNFMLSERAMSVSFINKAGRAAQRTCVVFGVEAPSDGFERKYRERFDVTPGILAYYGYLAGHAVMEALENADARDRDVIRASCARLPYFDAQGDLAPGSLKGGVVWGRQFVPE